MQEPEPSEQCKDKEPDGEHDVNMTVTFGQDVVSGLENAGHCMKKLVALGLADKLEGLQFTAPVVARTILEQYTPVFLDALKRRIKSGVPKRSKRIKVSRPKGR